MKITLVSLLMGLLCVSAGARKEPKVYDHVGHMGGGSVHPDSSYSVGDTTLNCFDHSYGTDCTTGSLGYFMITFDDGSKHMLAHTMRGTTVLQDIQLNEKLADKSFRYRLVPDEEYGRHTGIIVHVLCTPNRDKQNHETNKESCFSYEW